MVVDRDDECGGIGVEIGLGIAVGKTARVGSAFATHKVAFGFGVGTILAVETFG